MKKIKFKSFLVSFVILFLPVMIFAQTVNLDLESEKQTIRGYGGMNFPDGLVI